MRCGAATLIRGFPLSPTCPPLKVSCCPRGASRPPRSHTEPRGAARSRAGPRAATQSLAEPHRDAWSLAQPCGTTQSLAETRGDSRSPVVLSRRLAEPRLSLAKLRRASRSFAKPCASWRSLAQPREALRLFAAPRGAAGSRSETRGATHSLAELRRVVRNLAKQMPCAAPVQCASPISWVRGDPMGGGDATRGADPMGGGRSHGRRRCHTRRRSCWRRRSHRRRPRGKMVRFDVSRCAPENLESRTRGLVVCPPPRRLPAWFRSLVSCRRRTARQCGSQKQHPAWAALTPGSQAATPQPQMHPSRLRVAAHSRAQLALRRGRGKLAEVDVGPAVPLPAHAELQGREGETATDICNSGGSSQSQQSVLSIVAGLTCCRKVAPVAEIRPRSGPNWPRFGQHCPIWAEYRPMFANFGQNLSRFDQNRPMSAMLTNFGRHDTSQYLARHVVRRHILARCECSWAPHDWVQKKGRSNPGCCKHGPQHVVARCGVDWVRLGCRVWSILEKNVRRKAGHFMLQSLAHLHTPPRIRSVRMICATAHVHFAFSALSARSHTFGSDCNSETCTSS